jgi:hypothetical protein
MGAVETTGNLARFEEKPERYRPVLNDALKEISTFLTAPELDGIGSKQQRTSALKIARELEKAPSGEGHDATP